MLLAGEGSAGRIEDRQPGQREATCRNEEACEHEAYDHGLERNPGSEAIDRMTQAGHGRIIQRQSNDR